jgi:hypothetical protein
MTFEDLREDFVCLSRAEAKALIAEAKAALRPDGVIVEEAATHDD